MKKVLSLLMLSLVLVLAACGGNDAAPKEEKPKAEETPKEEPKKEIESKYPYPENDEEVGEGALYLEEEVLFIDPDTIIMQAGYELEEYESDKEAFLYLNGIFVEATQGGDIMSSIDLSEWMLEPGEYEVVAVQFADNDPTKEVVQLSKAKYTAKAGS